MESEKDFELTKAAVVLLIIEEIQRGIREEKYAKK